jgi:WD40 repeat protein
MVPSSVTIQAGKPSATFPITTKPYWANFSNLIAGKDSDSTASVALSIQDTNIKSLSIASKTLGGGDKENATVTLAYPAPTGGWLVNLKSANSAYVTVPATVLVAAGATTATFPVAAKPYHLDYACELGASDAFTSEDTAVEVLVDSITNVAFSSPTIIAGGSSTGTVTLDRPAPYGGWNVDLVSQYPALVDVPSYVTVPAGSKSVTFITTTVANFENYTSEVLARDIASSVKGSLNIHEATATIQIPGGAASIAYDPVHEVLIVVPSPGQPLAPTRSQNAIFIIDPSTGGTVNTVTLPSVSLPVTMSSDNSNIFVACADGTVRALDPSTYEVKFTATLPGGNASGIQALPGVGNGNSFIFWNGQWTYIVDETTVRPNAIGNGYSQAVSEDGTKWVGGDYRYEPNNYSVAKINAQGFYDGVSGYSPVSPNLTYVDGYPVDGTGAVLNPDNGTLFTTLPFVSSGNRQLCGIPNTPDVLSVSWGPDAAQVTDVAAQTSLGTFNLPNTDGGLGPVIYLGHHRMAYFTFGYISDYQIVIVVNPLIP